LADLDSPLEGKLMPVLGKILRWIVVLAALVLIAHLAHIFGNWLTEQVKMEITPENKNAVFGATVIAIILYALLIAIPFVPGVEIGIGLMVMFGTSMAIPVYIATVCGLVVGFLAGRLVPEKVTTACFQFLGLQRVSAGLAELSRRPVSERLEILMQRAPSKIVPFLLRHRYIGLAVAFNIPGNSVIGGGGGIAFIAGTSRLFSVPLYFLAVAIGVSPVTILVLVTGNTSVFG